MPLRKGENFIREGGESLTIVTRGSPSHFCELLEKPG